VAVESLISICYFSLGDFLREVQTVKILKIRLNENNNKYSAKCPDATPKERQAFWPPANPQNGLRKLDFQLRGVAG
jgi:hypothetical protein